MKYNPYDTLGVPHNASDEDIKVAYRAKAKTAHPDAGGSHEEFTRLNDAFEVLSSPSSREFFDTHGVIVKNVSDVAFREFTELFVSVVTNDSLPRSHKDPIKTVLLIIEQTISNSSEKIKNEEKKITKLKASLDGTMSERPENVDKLRSFVQTAIDSIEEKISEARFCQTKASEILKIAKTFSFKTEDEEEEDNQGHKVVFTYDRW